jgi:hypothetical protein
MGVCGIYSIHCALYATRNGAGCSCSFPSTASMYIVSSGLDNLSRGCIAAIVAVLCWARPACCRSRVQGFPGNFGSFFSRLLEVTVVPPEVGSIFAAMYEDTARPGCSYAYQGMLNNVGRDSAGRLLTSRVRVVLKLRLSYLIRGAIV